MTQDHERREFPSFTNADWKRLMQLVDLVSVVEDHKKQANNGDLIKGLADIGDRLYSLLEELSVECIERGLGAQVAIALKRLTPNDLSVCSRSARGSISEARSPLTRL
jgi:hypothetical protein